MRVPPPGSVAKILSGLFDRKVTAALAPRMELRSGRGLMAALYANDVKQPVYVCACDIDFSARAAAALALMPPAAAQDAIAARRLSEVLGENLVEVLNVCSQALNQVAECHVKLAMVGQFEEMPPKVRIACVTCGKRADLTVDIARYGSGRIAIIELPSGRM